MKIEFIGGITTSLKWVVNHERKTNFVISITRKDVNRVSAQGAVGLPTNRKMAFLLMCQIMSLIPKHEMPWGIFFNLLFWKAIFVAYGELSEISIANLLHNCGVFRI